MPARNAWRDENLPAVAAVALALAAAIMSLRPCLADLPPLIPRETLFGNPEKISPLISPDGKLLAYLAPDSKKVLNVWLRTLGQKDDKVVTEDKKRGVRFFQWQADGNHVLYEQDQDGDENYHVYQTDIHTLTTRDITPFQGIRAGIVGVDSAFPHEMLVSMNLKDRKLFDAYHADLKTGALELLCQNPGDVEGWTADNNLVVRACTAATPDGGREVRVRDTAASPWRLLKKFGPDEEDCSIYGFTPDNRSIVMGSSLGANAARLIQVELGTGKETTIAEDSQFDVIAVLRDQKSHSLEAVCFGKERNEWQVVDDSVRSDFEAIKRINPGDFSVDSQDLQNNDWIVSFTADDAPGNLYYLYNRSNKQSQFLFAARPNLESYELAKTKVVSFTARDGMKLHGYLTVPKGVEPKNLPMILEVHGGPWGRDYWGFNSTNQWLANRGFAVLQVNFRGSAGFGKEYLNAGDREWGGKMHNDIIDAKKWAVENGYADPHRVCIYGGSYGGYAALVGAAFTPDEFACAVDLVGPSNLVTLMNTIPPYWDTARAMFAKRVGNVKTEEQFLKSRSPLFKADRIKIPLLIIQGANDPRVKRAESDQIVAAVRKNGKPVEYMVFPDEGHGLARPENQVIFRAKMEEFLAKHLNTRLETAHSAEKPDSIMQ